MRPWRWLQLVLFTFLVGCAGATHHAPPSPWPVERDGDDGAGQRPDGYAAGSSSDVLRQAQDARPDEEDEDDAPSDTADADVDVSDSSDEQPEDADSSDEEAGDEDDDTDTADDDDFGDDSDGDW